ncbi:MAG: hypothetical protein AAGF90_13860, partial [Pseudomonadota bacterium]
ATALSAGLPAALAKVEDALARRPIARPILEDAGHAALEQAEAGEAPLAYARAVIDYAPLVSTDIAGDAARLKVARELRAIGLANAAERMLAPTETRGGTAVKLEAAAIQLALGAPDRALERLEGLAGAEPARLRAEAYAALGRLSDAAASAREATDEAPDIRAGRAFRAGDWAEAVGSGAEANRLLAAFMAGDRGAPVDDAFAADASTGGERPDEVLAAGSPPLADVEDPAAADAFVAPPAVGPEVTLRDARSVMDASETVRSVIEEALNDG